MGDELPHHLQRLVAAMRCQLPGWKQVVSTLSRSDCVLEMFGVTIHCVSCMNLEARAWLKFGTINCTKIKPFLQPR